MLCHTALSACAMGRHKGLREDISFFMAVASHLLRAGEVWLVRANLSPALELPLFLGNAPSVQNTRGAEFCVLLMSRNRVKACRG